MIAQQQHIIQKVSFDLDFGNEDNVRQFQNRFVDTFQKNVLPDLEKVFETWSGADEVIKIDKINIDLGDFDLNTSANALAQNMLLQVKKAIQSKLTTTAKNGKLDRISLEKAKLEIILHFLKKGFLPPTTFKINLEDDFKYLLQEKPSQLINGLKTAIDEVGGVIIRRVALQFSDEILELFFIKINEQNNTPWAEIHRKDLFKKLRDLSYSENKRIWKPLIEFVLSNKEIKSFGKIAESVQLVLDEEISSKIDVEESGIKEKVSNDPNLIFGNNVGVILLHPFLKSFFEESNLLDDQGKFKNAATKEKAIGLLHFLATGETKAEEFDLSFQKIICGVPVGFPIASEFVISDSEKEEAKKMLRAVIKYWSGLGNVSIDGLRAGFLQREGKIQQDDNSILLQVERKTMDILIGKIPWNISMVKLPWLEKMIRVDWA